MKKVNIVKKNEDFSRIINLNNSYRFKDVVLYLEKNTENNYRFGISVGKKTGIAVTRNKIKRQIKDIIDQKKYINGFNCIIMVKRTIVDKSYEEIRGTLFEAFDRIGIVKGDFNE